MRRQLRSVADIEAAEAAAAAESPQPPSSLTKLTDVCSYLRGRISDQARRIEELEKQVAAIIGGK